MDWRSVKFDWNRARAFLVAVEEGSLSAGARALGSTQPTISRQVNALEKELGVILFEREGRNLKLTPNGSDLVSHIREMGNAASKVSLAAAGKSSSLKGTVCVTASELDAAYRLPIIMKKLQAEEPGITIEIVVTNKTMNLSRREADIAIRSFKPAQVDMIGEKVRDVPCRLYSSPEYLDRITSTDPQDNPHHSFIGFTDMETQTAALAKMGIETMRNSFSVITDNHIAHLHLAKAGLGLAILPEDIGDREPRLVKVLGEKPPLIVPMWLVTHREMKTSKRVQRVFQLLLKELAQTHSKAK